MMNIYANIKDFFCVEPPPLDILQKYQKERIFPGLVVLAALEGADNLSSKEIVHLKTIINNKLKDYKTLLGTIYWASSVFIHIISNPLNPQKWLSSEEQVLNILEKKQLDSKLENEEEEIFFDCEPGKVGEEKNYKMDFAKILENSSSKDGYYSCEQNKVWDSSIFLEIKKELHNRKFSLEKAFQEDLIDFALFAKESSKSIFMLFPNPEKALVLKDEKGNCFALYSSTFNKKTNSISLHLVEIKNGRFYNKAHYISIDRSEQIKEFQGLEEQDTPNLEIENRQLKSFIDQMLGGVDSYTLSADPIYDLQITLPQRLTSAPSLDWIARVSCLAAGTDQNSLYYAGIFGLLGAMLFVNHK